jgi:hypothetical protein
VGIDEQRKPVAVVGPEASDAETVSAVNAQTSHGKNIVAMLDRRARAAFTVGGPPS